MSETLNEYYTYVTNNSYTIKGFTDILFPQSAIFTECDQHYVMELVGFSENFSKLATRDRKIKKIESLFDASYVRDRPRELSGSTHCCIDLRNTKLVELGGFYVANCEQLDLVQKRYLFPEEVVDKYPKVLVEYAPDIVLVNANTSKIIIENCVFVGKIQEAFRARFLRFAVIVSKNESLAELESYICSVFNTKEYNHKIRGLSISKRASKIASWKALELHTLILSDGIRETTIGDYYFRNPEVAKAAFGTDNFVYEPSLKWIEHDGSVDDVAINPDMLIERDDGYFDIVDLKLAGLRRVNLTKGERRRRRFVDYVAEGIAQLNHYESYFQFKRNAEWALEKYNIRVKDPNLILVVGNQENFILQEVNQALMAYKSEKLIVIDHETILRNYTNISDAA